MCNCIDRNTNEHAHLRTCTPEDHAFKASLKNCKLYMYKKYTLTTIHIYIVIQVLYGSGILIQVSLFS